MKTLVWKLCINPNCIALLTKEEDIRSNVATTVKGGKVTEIIKITTSKLITEGDLNKNTDKLSAVQKVVSDLLLELKEEEKPLIQTVIFDKEGIFLTRHGCTREVSTLIPFIEKAIVRNFPDEFSFSSVDLI